MHSRKSKAERFARRVAALTDRCYEANNPHLAKATKDQIAEIRCSTTVLQHKAEGFRRDQ